MPMINNIIMRHDCLIVLMMLVMTIIENIILIILAMLQANMMTMLNILACKRFDLMRTGINDALQCRLSICQGAYDINGQWVPN